MKLQKNTNFIIQFGLIIGLLIVTITNLKNVGIGFDQSDSPSYFNFDLINPLRMPIITFIYSKIYFLGGIVIVQNIISIFTWILLAVTIQKIFSKTYIKIISSLLIYSLALSSQVQEHNYVILSESFTISSSILIVSLLLLLFIQKGSNKSLFILVLSIIFFSGVKQSNNYFGLLILILVLIYLFKNRLFSLFKFVLILLTFPIMIILLFIGSKNLEIKSNLTLTTIIERTYDDYSARQYWKQEDFPQIAYQIYSGTPTKNPIDLLNENFLIKSWKQQASNYTIEMYAIKNPSFLLLAPLKPSFFISNFTDFESIINSLTIGTTYKEKNYFLNVKTNNSNPNFLENLRAFPNFFWPNKFLNEKTFMILFLSLLLISLSYLKINLNYLNKNIFNFILISILFILLATWLNWHITVTYELNRYLIPWAILLRIFSIITFMLVFETFNKKNK